LLEVHPASELTARDVLLLPYQRLEQVRRLDRDGTAAAGDEEVRADVAAQARQPKGAPARREARVAPRLTGIGMGEGR
jgi:hypothetical protein